MRPDWPSNVLTAEIEKPDGRKFSLRPNDPNPENRPLKPRCGSKFMEGFSQASFELAREEAVSADLAKLDTLRMFGVDGRLAWEGRVDDFVPSGSEESPRVLVTAVGWMAHARDRPMPPVLYKDMDASRWTGPGQQRRDALDAADTPNQSDPEARPDGEQGALRLEVRDRWEEPTIPRCEAWYDAGPGQAIGRIYSEFASHVQTAFVLERRVSSDDKASEIAGSADLYTETSGTDDFETNDGFRFAFFSWRFNATPAGDEGAIFPLNLRKLAVYGNHSLPLHGADPGGLLVSDVIKHSAGLYAPLLDTSQIRDSSHIVDQVAERDLIDPYDFWLRLNKYERRHLAVWEERRLYYNPLDLDRVDWRVRDGELGTEVSHHGPGAEPERNGVIVRFQNVATRRADMVTPDDDARLADTDPRIPANAVGIRSWEPLQLPNPDSREGAIRYGQLVLAELNRQRQPATITIRGCIRDGARHWQPGWAPRAGQTVLVENRSGPPRLITEPDWDGNTETLTLTVDGQADSTDAILDQLLTEQKLRSR